MSLLDPSGEPYESGAGLPTTIEPSGDPKEIELVTGEP
jgi:hypothetical protein